MIGHNFNSEITLVIVVNYHFTINEHYKLELVSLVFVLIKTV